MLVYLVATSTHRLCRRDTLMAMFWPEADTERARAALRQALHFIRQELGEDILVTRAADEIGVQPGAIEVDVNELMALAEGGKHAEALALYGGDFLDRFFIRGAPEFERWVTSERDRLRKRAAECAWALVESRVGAGDMRGAREIAQRAVQLSPDSEIAVRRFIELLARSGDHVAALSAYRELETYLADEFGVKPSRETLALVRSLSQPRTTPPALAAIAEATEPPPTPPAPAAPPVAAPVRKLGRRLVPLAAALVLIISAAGALWQNRRANARPAMDSNRIAVLPFLVRGDNTVRYLHDGLPLLLSTRLDGALELRTVDMRAILLEQARSGGDSISLESASSIARGFGAGLYVVGTVVGSNAALHIVAELHDSQNPSQPVARAQVDGAETELVALVDRLSAALLADRFRERGGLAAEMAARTSPSFAALKAWLEGESAMATGRYVPAMASFRTAIAADTTFAMAYYRLAVAASWAGAYTEVLPATERAIALSDHLPPSARSFVQAFHAYRQGRYSEAEQIDRALLAERPASIDVQFDLAELLYHGNPPRGRAIDEARESFEAVLRQDPRSFPAMSHLARLAASRGDVRALDSLSRNALAGNPDGPHRAELLLFRAISLKDSAAMRAYTAMPADLTHLDALWRVAEYLGALRSMQPLGEALLARPASDEMRSSLLLFLTHVAMGREQFGEAERFADSLSAHAPQHGAVMLAHIAQHPRADGVTRARVGARARAILASMLDARPNAKSKVYSGASRQDDGRPYIRMEYAMLSMMAGDSSYARRLLSDSALGVVDNASRLRLQLAFASTPALRESALRAVAILDSIQGSQFAPQVALSPRAVIQLAISDLYVAAGKRAAALKRLGTIPEDFGFNIGYLAEVHRRRASLLKSLGEARESEKETSAAAFVAR